MYNIHPDYKTKKVLTFVADLIIEYQYDTYDNITESDLFHFAALLNEAGGATDELSFISEDSHTTMESFRDYLINNNSEDFLDAIKTSALHYYEHTMKSIFNYVYSDYQQSRREWLDHTAKYGDPDAAYDQYRESLS